MQAILTGLTRLTNTPSGNPRWNVHTNQGSWKTEPDSQCASLLSETLVGQVVELAIEHGRVRFLRLATAHGAAK